MKNAMEEHSVKFEDLFLEKNPPFVATDPYSSDILCFYLKT